ncbi:MAG: glycosyltransferase [Deltaproteobacteria bacterium]|nr:glycosyltransferase [Deltaproteobacteria bacterium]
MKAPAEADRPTVSVATITYNHERFIRACVESVQRQQALFRIEHVIGDDASPDGTLSILDELAAKYSDRIRVLRHSENIGMHRNADRTLRACRGRYVALLEGDDQFLSEDKLARQVSFLETHPECSICFHPVTIVDNDGRAHGVFPEHQPPITTLDDLLRSNFIGTPSVMYRVMPSVQLPSWTGILRSSDWLLHILHAEHGKIGFIDDVRSLYRVHSGGAWTSLAPEKRWASELEMLRLVDIYLGYRHHDAIRDAMAHRHLLLASAAADAHDLRTARWHCAQLLLLAPSRLPTGRRAIVPLILRVLGGSPGRGPGARVGE